MRLAPICLSALVTTIAVALICFAPATAPVIAQSAAPAIVTADNFMLVDHKRRAFELHRLKDSKAIVILTYGANDAATKAAIGALKTMLDGYAGKDVDFFLLDSEPSPDRDAIGREIDAAGLDAPVLLDTVQLVGEQLGVTRTAEALVIDPRNWQVVYRGSLGATTPSATETIDALLAGGAPKPTSRAGAGREIAFPARAKSSEWSTIYYASTIAPIVEQRCVRCHQPGGAGPMALTSHEAIRAAAPMIREAIRTDRMPPFNPDTSVLPLKDDLSLTAEETKTLVHWIEAGAPRGPGEDPLASKTFKAPEWELGPPDLVVDIPAYTIPASGVVQYQRPAVANPLKEGRWLRASTVKVGQRQGVHHVLSGYMAQMPADGRSHDEDWRGFLGGYGVGSNSMSAPTDLGSFVPAGGAIGFQNHYTPFGREATDASQIGFYFLKQKPKYVLHDFIIQYRTIRIPPYREGHKEIAYVEFPSAALLYAAAPHAHYRAVASDLRIRYPDGREKLLMSLPRYDFNWQRIFEFAEPVAVPAGSLLVATYTYDNSARNPGNPEPARTVTWGEQSFEEMFYTAIRYRWLDETSDKPVDHDNTMANLALLGMIDDNLDGKLQLTEIKPPFGQIRLIFARADANGDGSLDKLELMAALAGGR